MIKHYKIRIFGQVQGVNLRYLGKIEAVKLGLAGFIKNQPDGNVAIEAEGQEAALAKFVAWCRLGPPLARVTKVEAKEGAVKGYSNFEIRYD